MIGLKSSLTGEIKVLKGKSLKDGNYLFGINDWILKGIEYEAKMTINAVGFK